MTSPSFQDGSGCVLRIGCGGGGKDRSRKTSWETGSHPRKEGWLWARVKILGSDQILDVLGR